MKKPSNLEILAGIAAAGAVAYLFSTDKGKDLRNQISEKLNDLASRAEKAAEDLYAQAKETTESAKEELGKYTQKLEKGFEDAKTSLEVTKDKIVDEVKEQWDDRDIYSKKTFS